MNVSLFARRASLLLLTIAATACGDAREQEEARGRRARQMRDVSRMLDAMEASDPAAIALMVDAAGAEKPRVTPRKESPPAPAGVTMSSWFRSHWAFVAMGGAGGAVVLGLALVGRRRRVKAKAMPERPSIARHFPDADPVAVSSRGAPTPTDWVYRASPFETPDLEVVAEPVDLLVPFVPAHDTLRDRLLSADPGRLLHLVGDERFPEIRCIGEARHEVTVWEDLLAAASDTHDDDGRLARWLLPALHLLRANGAPKHDAERLLLAAEENASDAMEHTTGDEPAHQFARWIRIRQTRAMRLSGATRLFALRDLLAHVAGDPRSSDPLALDACIDVHLTWASWLFGEAARTRLAAAEQVCDRLGSFGPDAATRALRRRGEVWLRYAQLQKPAARLPDLDHAQALLDDAHERMPNAETALLVAQAARQRALLLPAMEAATACSHALLHAFLAEQDPAWRIDALACRLDIQLTYEALPEHANHDSVSVALRRSLAMARSTH